MNSLDKLGLPGVKTEFPLSTQAEAEEGLQGFLKRKRRASVVDVGRLLGVVLILGGGGFEEEPTVREIAGHIGVSQGTLFNSFKTPLVESILGAGLESIEKSFHERNLALASRAIAHATSGEETTEQSLRSWLEYYLETDESHQISYSVMLSEHTNTIRRILASSSLAFAQSLRIINKSDRKGLSDSAATMAFADIRKIRLSDLGELRTFELAWDAVGDLTSRS